MARKGEQAKAGSETETTGSRATGRRGRDALQVRGGGTGGGGKTRGGAQVPAAGQESQGGRPAKSTGKLAAKGRGRSGTTSGGGRTSARTRTIKQEK